MPKVSQKNLKATNNMELLSYIINQDPVLKEEIGLPTQGTSIQTIGKIIMNNQRYKNAFLNVCNIIGLTVIKRNTWDNPWDDFTERGVLSHGQQVREIMVDLANVYDYNENVNDVTRFLKTVVPNVYEYMHEINFQKFYQETTSDVQMSMAFDNGDLFNLIDIIVSVLWESLKYDRFVINKYQLCRRIVDGTVTAIQIKDFANKTDRDIVAEIKSYSDKMTFPSHKYNPAGVLRSTSFDNQIAIVSTDYNSKFTTNVLATSYFKDEASMKSSLALIDGFGEQDMKRLVELFGKRDVNDNIIPNEYIDGYVPFKNAELEALKEIPAMIITKEFFMNYVYSMTSDIDEINNLMSGRITEFFNPTTLRKNTFLHYWGIFSTSPYEQAIVFTTTAQGVRSVTVSPATASVSKGQKLQLSADVVTTGFANKAVIWSIPETTGVKINQYGELQVGANAAAGEIVVTATSVYDDSVTGTATITIV